MSYKLKLDIFEGPLDLLLFLIKKDDIDIHDIPIAQVTDQYMQYIEMMKMLDLDIVGEFLVMAATLMHIKSKMLLPPDPSEEEEVEDPRDELTQRLLEYKKFKEVAETLHEKEQFRQDLFTRLIDEEERSKLKEEAKEIYFESTLFDLINAFSEALKKVPEEVIHEIIKEEWTVEQKIHELLHKLLDQSVLSLKKLFGKTRSKTEAIVTFIAVLELIRLKEIKVMQKTMFGEIEIVRNKDNIIPQNQSQDSSESEETPQSEEATQTDDTNEAEQTEASDQPDK